MISILPDVISNLRDVCIGQSKNHIVQDVEGSEVHEQQASTSWATKAGPHRTNAHQANARHKKGHTTRRRVPHNGATQAKLRHHRHQHHSSSSSSPSLAIISTRRSPSSSSSSSPRPSSSSSSSHTRGLCAHLSSHLCAASACAKRCQFAKCVHARVCVRLFVCAQATPDPRPHKWIAHAH